MSFNLYYIRAAIQQRTGQVLKFERIRQLLLEEGLISQRELDANPLSKEFGGYGRYFFTEECSVEVPHDPKRFIPIQEILEDGFDED
tara:strand:- start:319 stop:579 length:261 start_codon:yes stop_codon:yes gene_type:complete